MFFLVIILVIFLGIVFLGEYVDRVVFLVFFKNGILVLNGICFFVLVVIFVYIFIKLDLESVWFLVYFVFCVFYSVS